MHHILPATEDTTARETVCLAQRLPNEVLDIIFAFYDNPAPSASRLCREPDFQLTACNNAVLKAVSCVCKSWRPAALPILFRHARFFLQYGIDAPGPDLDVEVTPFLDFIQQEDFGSIVETFVLGISDGVEEANYRPSDCQLRNIVTFWHSLFKVVDAVRITIVAPPAVLGSLTCCFVDSDEVPNFQIPYHILSLSRAVKAELRTSDIGKRSKRYSPCHKYGLFNIRPWSSLLLNEGSFLNAYRLPDEERRWRRPPSILHDLVGVNAPHPKALIPATVRSLSYIAICPFWLHFTHLNDNLPRLSRLYLQFVPIEELAMDYWQREEVDVDTLELQRSCCYDELLGKLLRHDYPDLYRIPDNYRYLREVKIGGAAVDPSWSGEVETRIKETVADRHLAWRMEETGVLRRDLPS